MADTCSVSHYEPVLAYLRAYEKLESRSRSQLSYQNTLVEPFEAAVAEKPQKQRAREALSLGPTSTYS
jgi:hypothetical protein